MTDKPMPVMKIYPEECSPDLWYEITYRGDKRVVARRDRPETPCPWSLAGAEAHGVSDRMVSDPVPLFNLKVAMERIVDLTSATVSQLLPDTQKQRAERAEKALEEAEERHANELRFASERYDEVRRERDTAQTQADGVAQEGHDAISFLSNALRDAIYQAGDGALPLERGYPWFDALHEYAPDALAGLVDRGSRALAHIAFDHDAWPNLSEDSRETFRRLDRAGITIKDGEGHA